MKKQLLNIINYIRQSKGLSELPGISPGDRLRDEIGFTSFDLAELTVRVEDVFGIDIFEDGLVETIGQVYSKLNV